VRKEGQAAPAKPGPLYLGGRFGLKQALNAALVADSGPQIGRSLPV